MPRWSAAVGSAVFLVVAPGVVAGVVPWLLTSWSSSGPPLRSPSSAPPRRRGSRRALHAFGRFVVEGRGTPAPVAPTEQLVVGGLYRHVRNPMYVAVGATIVGQALLLGRPWLLAYAAAFWAVVAAFVHGYEEPTLSARYGQQYAEYRRAVPLGAAHQALTTHACPHGYAAQDECLSRRELDDRGIGRLARQAGGRGRITAGGRSRVRTSVEHGPRLALAAGFTRSRRSRPSSQIHGASCSRASARDAVTTLHRSSFADPHDQRLRQSSTPQGEPEAARRPFATTQRSTT